MCNGDDGVDGVNGAAGADGNTWTVGTGAPTGGVNSGDMYLDDATNDYYSFDGVSWSLDGNLTGSQTISTLVDNGNGTFTYTDETGTPTTFDANIDDADADATNEIQDLQLVGNNLTITNNGSATTIDLSPYLELPGTATTNEVLTWNGSSWVAQAAAGGDNWGTDVVNTSGSNISGDGLSLIHIS